MKVDPKYLPFFIQDELFLLKDESSVQGPERQEPEEKALATKMLVVVDSQDSVDKAKKKDSFLDKVLASVKVKLAEIQIESPQEYTPGNLAEFKWVLFFGVPDLLQSQAIPYQVAKDPFLHLVADSLEEIEAHREKKAKLWNCLQEMFNTND